MTQDKAPEWAIREAEALTGKTTAYSREVVHIARALSQAYERGQESMRERAATWHDGFNEHELKLAASYLKAGLPFDAEVHGRKAEVHNNAASFIRYLPIEQDKGGVE